MAAAQAAMSEVWPDTCNEGYIHKFQPEPQSLKLSSHETSFK